MKLSILTATYNRGKFLPNLYKSIMKNLNNNLAIQWIIIDDGSTDETRQIVKSFNCFSKIEIVYFHQSNLGKMASINKAMEFVNGELVVDCDSDDIFADNCFSIIKNNADILLSNSDCYALCFLKKDLNGKISGKKFLNDYMKSTMFELNFKYDIKGEKILVFNSKIRKLYKHQLEHNEKFVTEARMYHKMDEKFKIICINKVIEMGEYINDGYTKNLIKTFDEAPYGYYFYFKEILHKNLYRVKLKKQMYILKNFWYFWIKIKKSSV